MLTFPPVILFTFFIFNLLSGLFFFGEMTFQGWEYTIIPFVTIVAISALIAFIEYQIVKIVEKSISVHAGYVIAIIFSIIYTLLILIDTFVYSHFGMILGQESLFILAETNRREATEFINTYTSTPTLCIAVVACCIISLLSYKVYHIAIKKVCQRIIILLALLGFFQASYGSYSYIAKSNGMNIPQYSVITRCLYGCYTIHQISLRNDQLATICRDLEYTLPAEVDTIPHIVVVIGESTSSYHCSVYGYDKTTWPRMEARRDAGELIAYRNVTTPYDATNWVMRSIFSLDPSEFGSTPILPAIFHSAGYRTSLIENQYFVGNGMTFLCHQSISDLVFDYRKDGPFKYDEEMLYYIDPKEDLSFDIIHLVGQHYAYGERYPGSFEKFHAADYDPKQNNEQQRQIIAQYDNAGLYCDYVLDQIIRKYESIDCMLVFFSDHGEEVYETRDFYGHGSSATAPDKSFLFHIPFFVWTSAMFRDKHSARVEQLKSESEKEICTELFTKWIVKKAEIISQN